MSFPANEDALSTSSSVLPPLQPSSAYTSVFLGDEGETPLRTLKSLNGMDPLDRHDRSSSVPDEHDVCETNHSEKTSHRSSTPLPSAMWPPNVLPHYPSAGKRGGDAFFSCWPHRFWHFLRLVWYYFVPPITKVFCFFLCVTFLLLLLSYQVVLSQVSVRASVYVPSSSSASSYSQSTAYVEPNPLYTTTQSPSSTAYALNPRLTRTTFYTVSFFGGMLAGVVHFGVLPLDMIKCRVQVGECPSLWEGLRQVYVLEARRSWRQALSILMKGWVPAVIGYGAQASLKFMFYEFFKSFWIPDPIQSRDLPPQRPITRVSKLRTFLLAGAMAEVLADIPLIPWETVKVQMQTAKSAAASATATTATAVTFSAALMARRVWETQGGLVAFYRGLGMLWMRQIPSTASKFFFFELSVMMFTSVYFLLHEQTARGGSDNTGAVSQHNPRTSSSPDYVSERAQLIISLLSGTVSGALSAFVSHPADTLLSKMTHSSSSSVATTTTTDFILSNGGSAPLGRGGASSFTAVRIMVVSCVSVVLRHTVFSSLWKGVGPRMLMAAILAAMQWVVYDSVKVYCGFAATGSGPKH